MMDVRDEQPMIRIEGLYKDFGGKEVLRGIDIDVHEGESLVILGGSGMGKSVLMKIVMGLMKPSRGKVYIEGHDITAISERHLNELRKDIGMMFQEGALFDSMSVGENVAFGLVQLKTNMTRDQMAERVAECLKMVGLPGTEKVRISELSGGMRKRVALARAIAYQPKIIIYDEPTSALDPIMGAVITKLIHRLNTNLKVTSVTITHDLKSAYIIADRIALLINGQIVEEGTPDQIFTSTNPYVKQFVTGSDEGPIEVVQ
jgi:phospholipid/cholesterol/gamma-HCH transport system ATP-binding protein